MMKLNSIVILLLGSLLFSSCSGERGENEMDDESLTMDTVNGDEFTMEERSMGIMRKDGLTLSIYDSSPTFDGAKLTLNSPKNGDKLPAGNVKFDYAVDGYELGAQTADALTNGLANSGKGQHVHAILNNEPYMAHYEPGFEKELSAGRYILLSFLSRSYHESLKNPEASSIIQFMVGDTDAEMADLSTPHLFYSRPKGEYSGADAQKLLLDFYLVNANLSADGYKVRATLNGTEFMLDTWAAYTVEGLPMGDVSIKLELLDGEGNRVESPFNPAERTVTLKADEMNG